MTRGPMGHILDMVIRCLRAKRVGIIIAEKMAVEKNYSFIECQLEINPPKSVHHFLIQHPKCDRYLLVVVILYWL